MATPAVASSAPDHEWDNDGKLILTGSANAYVATTARKIRGYFEGLRICGRANFTNSGPATIAVDEAGPVAIRKPGNGALVGGEIVSGGYYDFVYDAANAVMQATSTPGNGSVTNAQLANMAAQRIKARVTAGAGPPEDATLSEVLDFIGSAAQGDILYRGASAWARLGAGTNRQFLQTQGAAADPQYAYAGATLLTSGTVSAAATLDLVLTSYTAFKGLVFFLENFIPATDNTALWMRVSTNGGSSYDAAAGNYRWSYGGAVNLVALAAGSTSDIVITLTQNVGNGAAEGASAIINLLDQTNTAVQQKVLGQTVTYHNDDACSGAVLGARRLAAQDTDAVRFMFSTGNIASGKYAVYGLAP